MAKKKIEYPIYRSDANNPPDDAPEERSGALTSKKSVKPLKSNVTTQQKAQNAERIRQAARKKLRDERKREIEDAKTLTPDMLKPMTDPRETMA